MKTIFYSVITCCILMLSSQYWLTHTPTKKTALVTPTLDIKDIEQALKGIQSLDLDISPLNIVLDNYTNCWSPRDKITISANRIVSYQSINSYPPQMKSKVSSHDLYRLTDLLIAHKAWIHIKQKTHSLDDCRVVLTIDYQGKTSEIWEWSNEMPDNERMINIKKLTYEIVLKK